ALVSDSASAARFVFLTAAANLETADLSRAQICADGARAGASIDDGAAVPVRSDLDIVRRAVGAEVDGAAVHHASFQKEPITRGEGVLGHASEGGPGRPPGGAISSVVAVPADVIGLAGNSAGRGRGQHDDHACGQKTRSKLSSHDVSFRGNHPAASLFRSDSQAGLPAVMRTNYSGKNWRKDE